MTTLYGIIALIVTVIGSLFGAVKYGQRTQRNADELEDINRTIATEGRIRDAIRDADSSHDWRGKLSDRSK